MSRDKDQQMMFNSDELSLLKNTFADNDTLLYTVRKVLLQFPLTDVEKGYIRLSITPEVVAVIKKRLQPDLSDDLPMGQLVGPLFNSNEQTLLMTMQTDDLRVMFESKKLVNSYIKQQLAKLADLDAPEPISFAELASLEAGDTKSLHINLRTFYFLLGYIDPSLQFIKSLAGTKDETPEDQKKRLTRDSSK